MRRTVSRLLPQLKVILPGNLSDLLVLKMSGSKLSMLRCFGLIPGTDHKPLKMQRVQFSLTHMNLATGKLYSFIPMSKLYR